MSPLNIEDRREGRKAMEKSLTAAARMRRRFKAGRPPKIVNVVLKPFEAVHRFVSEAGKARDLMVDEGLDPYDVQCALVYQTPEWEDHENDVGYRWLPAPGETLGFFRAVEELAMTTPIIFLGILWYQVDREAALENQHIVWVTQFMGGPKAEAGLLKAREHFRAGGNRMLDN